jgi:diguanylate cyclase (GGDEF)-like protein
VARLGGDEFAALLPNDDSGLIARVHDALAEAGVEAPDGTRLGIEASVGHAPYDVATEIDDALAAADQRMYAAKRRATQRRG